MTSDTLHHFLPPLASATYTHCFPALHMRAAYPDRTRSNPIGKRGDSKW
ncbi:MAG: hypothetical protein NTW74_15070 [Acidobacteria bacterium]|nr:hypothetical protein [Acidobacteriota bacterium]